MSERRNMSDFFLPPEQNKWKKMRPEHLLRYGLWKGSDIRLHDHDHNNLLMVLAVRRSTPSSSEYTGHFSIDKRALEFLIHHQQLRHTVRAYVMLVDDDETGWLAVDTAMNVQREFGRFAPLRGRDGMSEYWWSDDGLRPFNATPRARMLDEEPDWLGSVPPRGPRNGNKGGGNDDEGNGGGNGGPVGFGSR